MAERTTSRKDSRFDPIKSTTQLNTGTSRRSESSSSNISANERDGRDSQMSNYSNPGPMDQDTNWVPPIQKETYIHGATFPPQQWDTSNQDARNTLTSAIFYTMECLVEDLKKAMREGLLPSNFDEQLGHTGQELVELLARIGVKGRDTDDKVSSAIAKLADSFAEARKADSARLDKIEQTLQIGTQKTARPNWAAESYAARAATEPTMTHKTVSKKVGEKTSKEKERAAQFVVRFTEPVPEETLGKIRVATAKWNLSGNLVLSTMAGQAASPLEPFFGDLHDLYTTTGIVPQDTKLNQVWHKLIVDGVSTGSQWRLNNGIPSRPHNTEELKEEMRLYNPILTELTFALDPRFVIPAAELAHKKESSVQFAVADQQAAETILKNKTLNLFGKACKVRKYQERTTLTPQCRRCNAFGHREDKCKNQPRCALCGDNHTEVQHTLQCGACKANPRYEEVVFDEESVQKGIVAMCTHNLSATSRTCPERIRAMGTTRDVNRTQEKSRAAPDQFQTVTKRRSKPKKSGTDPAPTPVVSQSRFEVLTLTPTGNADGDHDMDASNV
ncbi:hypothetical protein EV361DRAFT_455735 [Lentinula raphanica]|nr:hypothetical protein EV361DRAFT_455735 [Lentinula raphanica]